VLRADFIWNSVGVYLVLLGLLFYKYTREKTGRYLIVERAATIGASVLLFYGKFALNYGLFSHYEYCYATGLAIPGLDCHKGSTPVGHE
jgi:hypothetical protein